MDDGLEATALAGHAIWGDAFPEGDLQSWFQDETGAYEKLDTDSHTAYGYHEINRQLGWSRLPDRRFARVLGLGSADGNELTPLADRVGEIHIIEPGAAEPNVTVSGISRIHHAATWTGDLPFPDDYFDLSVSLGTLHHIANVSHVISELARTTAPGGWAVIREPIISMGDWRTDRGPGITARERGIPRALLEQACTSVGYRIHSSVPCMFPLTRRLPGGFNSPTLVGLDRLLSRCTNPFLRYHAQKRVHKVRPTCIFLVMEKLA